MEAKRYLRNITWRNASLFTILIFGVLQVERWVILPQFMDIYYHLATAWGFVQAGGYSGWDFWQYAPVGRVHIYPPFVHFVLGFFLKLGVSAITLAKMSEVVTPVAFLIVVWRFCRSFYSDRFAFFVLMFIASSYSFYMGLTNHVPATWGLIFGIIMCGEIMKRRSVRAGLLLSLVFYTHIGVSWYFVCALLVYSCLDRKYAKPCFIAAGVGLCLATPIIFKQAVNADLVTTIGATLSERYACQFKIFEYVFAAAGIYFALRLRSARLLFALLLASIVFIGYPYRLFSAEGYFPVALIAAFGAESLAHYVQQRRAVKYWLFISFVAAIIFSPTIAMDRKDAITHYKIVGGHSAFLGMLLPDSERFSKTMWVPGDYLSSVAITREHSAPGDIVYSNFDLMGVVIGGLSGRATSNALLPEIKPQTPFDQIASAKLVVFPQSDGPDAIGSVVREYGLELVAENKLFLFFKNARCAATMTVKKAVVPFWMAGLIFGCAAGIFFWLGRRDRVASG